MSSMSELDAIRCELGLTEDQANTAIQGASSFAHAVSLLHDAAGEDSPVVLPPAPSDGNEVGAPIMLSANALPVWAIVMPLSRDR